MKLLFVGDVMLGRLVNQALKRMRPEYPWGNTLDVFRSADARFCNLECAISDRGSRWSPGTIREFQANPAEGERARSIAETMQTLCNSRNTASSWNPGDRRLTLSGI